MNAIEQRIASLRALVQSVAQKTGPSALTRQVIHGEQSGTMNDVIVLPADNAGESLLNRRAMVRDYIEQWAQQLGDLAHPKHVFTSNGDGTFFETGNPSRVLTVTEDRMIYGAPNVPEGLEIPVIEDADGNGWGLNPYVG